MEPTSQTLEKDKILEELKMRRKELEGFGVRRLGLFGSFVRQEQGPESDIDILVEFQPGKASFRNFMGLCFYLDSLFKPRKVDLVSAGGLSRHIGPRILKEVEYALT